MYKALNYWVFGGFDAQKTPYEFVDFAAKKGLDGIELTVGDVLPIDITKEECEKIASYAKSKNVGLRTLASGGGWNCNMGGATKEERENAIAFTEKYLQIAKWIGAETILVVPGATRVAWDPSRPVIPYRQVWENAQASLKRLIPVAEKLGINIALENVWNRFLISPMEWNFKRTLYMSVRNGISGFGLCVAGLEYKGERYTYHQCKGGEDEPARLPVT